MRYEETSSGRSARGASGANGSGSFPFLTRWIRAFFADVPKCSTPPTSRAKLQLLNMHFELSFAFSLLPAPVEALALEGVLAIEPSAISLILQGFTHFPIAGQGFNHFLLLIGGVKVAFCHIDELLTMAVLIVRLEVRVVRKSVLAVKQVVALAGLVFYHLIELSESLHDGHLVILPIAPGEKPLLLSFTQGSLSVHDRRQADPLLPSPAG